MKQFLLFLVLVSSLISRDELPFDCKWLPNKYYDNCYSTVTNSAVIVKYTLYPEDVSGNLNRLQFTPDYRLSNPIYPEDYKYSGYDRGHLASDASFDSNYDRLTEAYLMSNIVPMTPTINRGIWRKLEDIERKVTRKYGKSEVVNYVLFSMNGAPELIGDVVIPSAFVKEIRYSVDSNKFRKCYLVYNDDISIRDVRDTQVRCGTYMDYVEKYLP